MRDVPPSVEQLLHKAIATLSPAYVELLSELVRTPSVLGSEGTAQSVMVREMRRLGLDVDCFEIDPSVLAGVDGFRQTSHSYAGRPCVVGVLKGSGGGRSLILNAHIDTAPVERAGDWHHPPFSGTVTDGKLFGRGAWDDKAGCVEMLLLIEALGVAGVRLRGDLILKCVIDDEAMGNGTLACLHRGYAADAAVIVDGTWPERFIVSHLGHVGFRIVLRGRSAPASVAQRGANPVHAIGAIVDRLLGLVARKNQTASAWGTQTAPYLLNIGRVESGAWFGAVPADGILDGQYGFALPDDPDSARADIVSAVGAAVREREWPAGITAEVVFDGLETPVVVGDPNNPLVEMLRHTVGRLRGAELIESVISGHCDLRHYQARGIPACLYGPGGGKGAHSENEVFELAHLPLVAANLVSVAAAWCELS